MKYLLDTHTLLWFIDGNAILPAAIKEIIEDKNTKCYVSTASIWEIAIKISLHKLYLEIEFKELYYYLLENKIEILNIEFNHLKNVIDLPFIHRDPFDRIIIAQAQHENMVIITKDDSIIKYKQIKTIW